VTGLVAGTPFFFRVRAYNSTSASVDSGVINGTTSAPLFPPEANPPTGITEHSFTANWSASVGAVGYRLDVATDINFADFWPGYQNADVGDTTSKTVTGLTPGATVYYRVRAYNADSVSTDSASIIVTLLGIVATPTISVQRLDNGRVARLTASAPDAQIRY